MDFEAVIGLEVHAELETQSKMFCACPVVDSTQAEPNTAVCPVCSGLPGTLPVLNARAVEYALRVALALGCHINPVSIFARKNYFYPDLPKGYQISQYEQPLAVNGRLSIITSKGERSIRIRRVHLEEDTGKLTHITEGEAGYSLVDLNRAGVPLLEIVTEPDMHSAEEVRVFAVTLRSLLRYLGVNSGDMQKGVMRIEPNVSVRPSGSQELGTRTEIKNLNSFRVLERSVAYEIQRQSAALENGEPVFLQTMGWDDARGVTVVQRSKEEAHDYRYFPEPDLQPLVIEPQMVDEIRASLPEMPAARMNRFCRQYELSTYDAEVLTAEKEVADYFEQVVSALSSGSAKLASNYITGDLFNLIHKSGGTITELRISAGNFAGLIDLVASGEISSNIAHTVLADMFETGDTAPQVIDRAGLQQVSDTDVIMEMIQQVFAQYPDQVRLYLEGKETLANWFFGQVMRSAQGKANPQVIRQVLSQQLDRLGEV